MAPISPPAWMQAGSYPARTDRLVLAALLGYPGFSTDEATPLRIRQGVKPSYQNMQLKVRAAATPNMTVIVSAGFAFVDNHDVGGYGTYVCVNDADYVVTIAPAGGDGQYRKDCIVASVYDAETAGAMNEFRIEAIQGPYAASAGATVRGSLPPNAQILADVSVGPNQTSVAAGNIGDVRNYSVAAGGIVPILSTVDMNHPAPGQVRYRTDTDTFVYGKADGTTAALLDSSGGSTVGKSLFARKTAGLDRTSTTLTADPNLSVTLLPSAVYRLEATLIVSTTDAAGDISLQWQLPGASTGEWAFIGQDASSAGTSGSISTQAVTSGPTVMGAVRGADLTVQATGLVETDSAGGAFTLLWARSGSFGTVTLKARSHMVLTRVA